MNPFRRQLPVLSPLPLRAVLGSLAGGDPRDDIGLAIQRLFDADRVLLTDSGTSALALAIRAALAGRREMSCALPAFGCFDLATAALAAGARVALYDVDPRTLAPRTSSFEAALRQGCSVAVIVHHFGVPVPMAGLRALAAASGTLLIEDAAQALGAHCRDGRVGAGADATVLSFGRGKGTTAGSGGALLMSAAFAERLGHSASASALRGSSGRSRLTFTGKLFAQWLLGRPSLYGIPASLPFLGLGETVFKEPGEPRAMLAAAARVLQHTLTGLDMAIANRRRHAARLREAQSAYAPDTMVPIDDAARPGWLRMPFLVSSARLVDRERAGRLGILPSYPSTLGALESLRRNLISIVPMEGAATLVERMWTLPTHGSLAERDLVALERWIQRNGND